MPREPNRGFVRLLYMDRIWVVALAVMFTLPLAATAQEDVTTLSATVGIGNWVAGNAPMSVRTTIDSQILVTGTLEIIYGGASTHTPVDVPAGGSKVYEVPVRSPFGSGSLRINLLDEDDNRIATQSIRPEVADDELVVGVASDAALITKLSSMESAFDGITIEPVDTAPDVSAAELDALAYLVSAEPTPAMWEFVADGGRLITSSTAIDESGMDLSPLGTVTGTSVAWYAAPNSGEVFNLDTIGGNDAWSLILRPTPLTLIPSSQWGTPESSLLQSATSGGDGGLATIPWLPFGMLAYLVVIGPVNMFVLRRLGRRELAWITVPALALVTVGAFWVGGRQRLDSITARHATVAVAGDHAYQRTLTVLAAGNAGSYSIGLPDADAYAVSDVSSVMGGMVGTTAPGTVVPNGVSWDLPQLGIGAVETWSTPQGAMRPVLVDDDTVKVTNETSRPIDHWGAVANGNVYVSQTSIGPGEAATLTLDNRFSGWQGATLGDAIVDLKQLWDDNGYEVVAPLGYAAAGEMGARDYAFGISMSTDIAAEINGSATSVSGPTVWVAPLEWNNGFKTASGTVVGVGDFLTIEAGQGNLWIDSDRILLSFRASPDATGLRVQESEQGWSLGPIEAWNWSTNAFESITKGEAMDPDAYASAAGEVLLRVGRNEQTNEAPYPRALAVVWDDTA